MLGVCSLLRLQLCDQFTKQCSAQRPTRATLMEPMALLQSGDTSTLDKDAEGTSSSLEAELRRGPGLCLLLNTPHPPTAGPRQECCSTCLIPHNQPESKELAWLMAPVRGGAGTARHRSSGTQAADTPVAPTKDMAAALDSREAMLLGGGVGHTTIWTKQSPRTAGKSKLLHKAKQRGWGGAVTER